MPLQATVLDRKLRACDLDDLPHEWDTRYELVGGVLFTPRKASVAHQHTIADVLSALLPPVRAAGGMVRGRSAWQEVRLSEHAAVRTALLPAWEGVAVTALLPPAESRLQ